MLRPTRINIFIECESCGHKYSDQLSIEKTGATVTSHFNRDEQRQVSGANYSYAVDLHEWAHKRIIRCPNCRYTQSWMLENARKIRRSLWLLALYSGSFVAGIAVAYLIGLTGFYQLIDNPFLEFILCIPPVGITVAGLIYSSQLASKPLEYHLWNPNKGFRPSSKTIEPKIEIIE